MARTVELLLRENIKSLGKCGDIVRVSPGYARNFLVPRRMAVDATEDNKKAMVRRRAVLDAEVSVVVEKETTGRPGAARRAHAAEPATRGLGSFRDAARAIASRTRRRTGRATGIGFPGSAACRPEERLVGRSLVLLVLVVR